MKKYFLLSVILLLSQSVFSADFHVPTISRCLADLGTSNTKSDKVYGIYSDFYYEYNDKRDYAVKAVNELAKQFSSDNSECQSFTQPINRTTVKCYKVAGNDVCTIPSDAGEFIVVKDFVDSTQVVLTEYADDYRRYPKIKVSNDFSSLWVAQPDLCYSDLLGRNFDSQAHKVNIGNYKNFSDFRFVLARSSRDLVKRLAVQHPSCQYKTAAHPAFEMDCLLRVSKPSICSLASTGGGYFVFITDADNEVHLLFNRWD